MAGHLKSRVTAFMWRQVLVIAFALAALALGTLSGASATAVVYGDAGLLPAAALACEAEAERAHAVAFHPCGKLRNGMAIQCHVDAGVMPVTGAPVVPAMRDAVVTAIPVGTSLELHSPVYRPPRLG